MQHPGTVKKYEVYEITLTGKTEGNPFTDYTIEGVFTGKNETVKTDGFYNGGGEYKIRFMPSFTGPYRFEITGSFSGESFSGSFEVTENNPENHGIVRTQGFHFVHDDGTPYYPVGTTAYVWNLQSEEMQQKTLDTLSKGYFNKIRFCIFPKHYLYNLHEPISYPYEGTPCTFSGDITGNFYQLMGVQPGNDWDFTRFNPAHFESIEKNIERLSALGIEADIIVMHPYDRWGFSEMSPEQDDLYWKYVIARFAAYRNVWWSLANEYDLLRKKTTQDWERYAGIIVEKDPYNHLRSIHNCGPMYDHTHPWITHCSIQRTDIYKCAELVDEYRVRYQKPVILDEIAYEGDIDQGWGNISGQELTRRYWESAVRGGYATHGETFDRGDDILWWSHGGELHGESPERIKFLLKILSETPGPGLVRKPAMWDEVCATADVMGDSGYYLYYYGFFRPCRRLFMLDPNTEYRVEVIDTWDMTITDAGVHSGTFRIEMPRKEYMAVRIRKL